MSEVGLAELQRAVTGEVIGAQHAEYDEARRVWNGMIDRRPIAVVRAASVEDVPAVTAFARNHDLLLAVRGGGHSVAGNGTLDDGLVLDLGHLKRVDVDADAMVVRAEPGATLGDLDRATESAGLVVPVGVVSGTGLFGLTLGGGFGWLTRPYGLTIDNLLSAELVTAAGTVVHASDAENADLFWGIRGGGGNFGVATSLTFRAQKLGPQVYAGNFFYRRNNWRRALAAYERWTKDLPDELTSIVTFIVPPAAWEVGDDTIMLIGFNWAAPGGQSEADRLVGLLRDLAPPDVEVVEPASWVDWQSQADDLFPRGSRAYWKNVPFDSLSEDAIDVIVSHVAGLAPGSACDIHHMGGAFARVPEEATAFPNRGARFWLNIYGFWAEAGHDERRIGWTRSFHAAMEPWAGAGEYVNFLGAEGPRSDAHAAALVAYGPAKLARLAALKRSYDPTNMFRFNHNIPVG